MKYHAAREKQSLIVYKIQLMQSHAPFRIIEHSDINTDQAGFGNKVSIHEEGKDKPEDYYILGPIEEELDLYPFIVTYHSPFGRSVVGKKVGEDFTLEIRGEDVKFTITSIDKIESKKIANEAGVSVVPGGLNVIEDIKKAISEAEKIGFPLMVKASAGGGGKGMRIAFNEKELKENFNSAVNEAKSSFGDDRVFMEKFIEFPKHIEIQVLGDQFGNFIHLGERECSIQRRHQKVIEEAPSSFVDNDLRDEMVDQAIKLAKAVGYYSAGTVEFVVDKDKNFYFLEMNTRLQVEHPVTELITGIDLVEQMIKVAYGEKLEIQQNDVKFNGSAIECRIYAEDSSKNFLPSIGRLTRYIEPQGKNVRIDSGVVEGSEISMFYDPMISKLCIHSENREKSINLMTMALDKRQILY